MAVTQQDIAKLAGVSRGTVYRALNRTGPVKADVAKRIIKIAHELGYHPNRAGAMLVRTGKPLKIGIIIQSIETAFMHHVLQTIRDEQPRFADMGAELIVHANESIDLALQIKTVESLRKADIDGLAMTPVEDEQICELIDRLRIDGIPTVTFNTDMPSSGRLCYVGQDAYLSGRACAGLMHNLLGGAGKLLTITGYISNLSHQRRIDGFRSEVLSAFPDMTLLPMERCNDSNRRAFEIVTETIRRHPDLRGIYLSANGQCGACDAIRAAGRRGQIHVVCHDLTEENIRNTKDGIISFIVDQNSRAQALRPVEILLDYLMSGIRPDSEYQLTKIEYYNTYNV